MQIFFIKKLDCIRKFNTIFIKLFLAIEREFLTRKFLQLFLLAQMARSLWRALLNILNFPDFAGRYRAWFFRLESGFIDLSILKGHLQS